MSEENPENGTGANGADVPEIELIIKEEFIFTNKEDEIDKWNVQQTENSINSDKEKEIAKNNICLRIEKPNIQGLQLCIHLETEDKNYVDDNKVFGTNAVLEHNNCDRGANDSNHSHYKTKIEPSSSLDKDTTDRQDFANVVAEACDDLFENMENELDLNLSSEINTSFCECGRGVKEKKDSEAMQMAVSAVLHEGLSLGQAAKKFNVVKSTIWSRVSKHPKHRRRKPNKELGEAILRQLSAGESLSEISRSLNVAKSTVHQHKMRLTKYGMLPSVLNLKKDKDSNGLNGVGVEDRLMQAYRGCRVNGMSVRFASEFYMVPLTTLWRYIKRKQSAVSTILPKNDLLQCVVSEHLVVEPTISNKIDNNYENIIPISDIKTELNPEDQQLFEQTLLNHLFE